MESRRFLSHHGIKVSGSKTKIVLYLLETPATPWSTPCLITYTIFVAVKNVYGYQKLAVQISLMAHVYKLVYPILQYVVSMQVSLNINKFPSKQMG